MYGAQNKWCFVPCCTSTSVSTPEKVFVTVPGEYARKKQWFKAARRDMPKSKSSFFCCEDHFNFEEDMENYIRYKLMGGKILLKPRVVPHIFDCQPDRTRASSVPGRPLPAKRNRKQLVDEAITTHCEKPCTSTVDIEPVLSVSATTDIASESLIESEMLEIPEEIPPQTKSVGVQARPSYRSKYIMCQITASVQNTASSPVKSLQKDSSTSPFKKHASVQRLLVPQISSSDTEVGEVESSSFVPSTSDSDYKEFRFPQDIKDMQLQTLNVTRFLVEKKPKNYTGVPDQWFIHVMGLLETKTKISKDNVMLTLMKIKLNDPFVRLGDMFGMSTSNLLIM